MNIPMLVETFMARDDNPCFDELVALAVETGREGVKALKAQPVENLPLPLLHQSRCTGEANGSERLHGYRPCAY